MNSPGPVVQQSISTIGKAPKAESPAPEEAEKPAAEAGVTTEAAVEAPPTATEEAALAEATQKVTPPEEKKEDLNLDLSRRFDKVAKREANARRLEANLHSGLEELAAERKKVQDLISEYENALSDPIAHAMKSGKDPVALAKRFARPESEEAKEIRQIRAELDARKKAEEEREQEYLARQEREGRTREMQRFVRSITPDECPNLTAVYEPHQVPSLINEILSAPPEGERGGPSVIELFHARYDREPTADEVKELLEVHAEGRATKILSRQKPAAPPPEAVPTPESGPSSISNRHAAVTSSSKSRRLTEEERRLEAKRKLTSALETEGAERRSD